MIHSCYGSGCPNERWDGECKYGGAVRKCPIDMDEDEQDAEAQRENWLEQLWEEERG